MTAPKHIPQHYKSLVKPFDDLPMYLDMEFNGGWRPVMMTAHPDGKQLIILLERSIPGK